MSEKVSGFVCSYCKSYKTFRRSITKGLKKHELVCYKNPNRVPYYGEFYMGFEGANAPEKKEQYDYVFDGKKWLELPPYYSRNKSHCEDLPETNRDAVLYAKRIERVKTVEKACIWCGGSGFVEVIMRGEEDTGATENIACGCGGELVSYLDIDVDEGDTMPF